MSALPSGPSLLGTNTTLFTLTADMNTTADQTFVKTFSFGRYTVDRVVVTNASGSLTNAKGGVYVQPSKAGDPIIPAAQTYASLATAQDQINPTLYFGGQKVMTETPVLSLTTAQGAPASASWAFIGVGWSV